MEDKIGLTNAGEKVVVCSKCNGTGEVEAIQPAKFKLMKCPECKGFGFFKIKK